MSTSERSLNNWRNRQTALFACWAAICVVESAVATVMLAYSISQALVLIAILTAAPFLIWLFVRFLAELLN